MWFWFWIVVGVFAACALVFGVALCLASRSMRPMRPDDQEWTSEVGFWGQQ